MLTAKAVSGSTVWAALSDNEVNLSTVVRVEMPLQAGWNLVSLPLALCGYVGELPPVPMAAGVTCQEVGTVGSFFASVEGKVAMVRSFDATGAHTYDPALPDVFNDLTYLAGGYGYWVKMTEAATLVLEGVPLDPAATLSVQTGWNLVGYWGAACQHTAEEPPTVPLAVGTIFAKVATVADVFWPLGEHLALVRSFDTEGAHTYDPALPDVFNDLTYLGPGYGYWVKLYAPASLSF